MSWWQGEEEPSSSDEDMYSDDAEDQPEKPEVKPKGGKTLVFDSDSEDDDQRMVRPEKDKKFDEITKVVKDLRVKLKSDNKDWNAVHDEWEILAKEITKSSKIIKSHGFPTSFISCYVTLEDAITKDKETTMKQNNARFYKKCAFKVKKFLTQNPNPSELEKAIQAFRENPVADDESKADKPSDNTKQSKTGEDENPWTKEDTDEDTDEGWDEELSSSSDEDDGDFTKKDLSYWYTPDEVKPSKKVTNRQARQPKLTEEEVEKKAQEEKKAEDKKAQEKAQEKETKVEWTTEKIDKKIKDMLKERGSKGYSPKEQIKDFTMLITKIPELNKKLTVTFHLVNAQLDTNPTSSTSMSLQMWKTVYNELVNILETLLEHPEITNCENTEELAAVNQAETDILKLPPNISYGHLLFSVQKLHTEYLRSLQNSEAQSQDYINRLLSHEKDILLLLQYTEHFYHVKNKLQNAAAIAFREMEYLYYKRSSNQGGIEEAKISKDDEANIDEIEAEVPEPAIDEATIEEATAPVAEKNEDIELKKPKDIIPYKNLKETVARLVNLVYQHSTEDRHKRKTMLQHIYHLALHDMFFEARDLVLMTHLQENILKANLDYQVMFNRAMVQLGLAAFRKGRIEDANNCLQEIVANGKSKELLAQGIRSSLDKTNEQEKQERRRQIPYHQHINIDLIECVQLVSAMLLEIPNMAQLSSKRRPISKHFRKVLDYHERQVFTGPPENTRESVIVAAKALQQGNWKRCKELVFKIDLWKLMPNTNELLALVGRLIQEQALRTYLFTYGQFYDSISIGHLSTMFELDDNAVHALVSKMICTEDLYASLDQTTFSIITHGQDPTNLQRLALSVAEKVNVLGDTNEIVDTRTYDKRWQATTNTGNNQQHPRGAYNPRGKFGGYTPRSDRQISSKDRGMKTNANRKTYTLRKF